MRRMLALSASATALIIAVPAMAQDAPKPSATNDGAQVTEVVVTGFRASLQSALTAKRSNVLPLESVAPEDIGKMPDQNVAESLQRLPGVQIDDVNDERKILGGAVGASWRVTDALRLDLNWFYSKEDDTTVIYSNKLDFNQNQDASSTPSPGINTDDPYSIRMTEAAPVGLGAAFHC